MERIRVNNLGDVIKCIVKDILIVIYLYLYHIFRLQALSTS